MNAEMEFGPSSLPQAKGDLFPARVWCTYYDLMNQYLRWVRPFAHVRSDLLPLGRWYPYRHRMGGDRIGIAPQNIPASFVPVLLPSAFPYPSHHPDLPRCANRGHRISWKDKSLHRIPQRTVGPI